MGTKQKEGATAVEFARWIVANEHKRGTPEFEKVAAAYRLQRAKEARATAKFTFTSPDGKKYDVEGPAGSTKEQAFAVLQRQLAQPQKSGGWRDAPLVEDRPRWMDAPEIESASAEPLMAFDVEGARRAGYSDAEIAEHLAGARKFDVAGARKAGYSDNEIVSHLSGGSVAGRNLFAAEQKPRGRNLFADNGAAPQQADQPQGGVSRQLGLTARHALEGAAGVVGIAADPIGVTLDAIIPNRRGVADVVAERGAGPRYVPLRQNVSAALDRLGLPSPQTATERVVGGASQALVGGGGFVKGGQVLAQGPRLAQQAGRFLAAQPIAQGASAVTGAGSAEIARESGASPTTQLFAGLAGGVGVPGAAWGLSAGTRGVLRGGTAGRRTMQENLRAFEGAGTTPTVGQATESRAGRALESVLSRAPGSAGVMSKKAQAQGEEIGQTIESAAAALARRSSAERAGLAIDRGISGEGGFLATFRERGAKLYDEVGKLVPPAARFPVANTERALADITSPIKGAEQTSALLANRKLLEIREALSADVAAGTLPYEAMKALRTRVGDLLTDSALTNDVPKSQLKRLYGALTDDMKAAAGRDPKALAALERANTYWRAGMKRVDLIESAVQRNGGPERIFQAVTSGTREGATVLRSVLQSLPTDAQRQVAATMLRRLGRADPSKQDELGEVFSTERFLTNWNTLSPEAKSTLFNRFGKNFRKNMDQIAAVSANLRAGSRVFANPSGTGAAAAQLTTTGAVAMALLTGHFGVAGMIMGGAITGNAAARLMTSPTFVEWLARNTKTPIGALKGQALVLQNMAARSGDEDLQAFADALSQTGSRPPEQRKPGSR